MESMIFGVQDVEKISHVVEAESGGQARSSKRSNPERFFGRTGAPLPCERLSQGVLDDLSQRAVGLDGKTLDLPHEVVGKANRGPHMSKHILDMSICQPRRTNS